MVSQRHAFGRLALWLLAAASSASAHAGLYRCPSPFGEGSVITNIVNDSAAADRGCEPLQQRRSALDGEPRRTPVEGAASVAARAADAWMTPRAVVTAPARSAVPVALPPPAARAADTLEFKRVDAATQRQRDTDRHRILHAELDAELSAQQSLQAKPVPADGAQRDELRARQQRHAVNIDALKREISRLR
jgi:hypothetical protein